MLHTIRKGIAHEMRKHWGGDMVGLAGVSFHDAGMQGTVHCCFNYSDQAYGWILGSTGALHK